MQRAIVALPVLEADPSSSEGVGERPLKMN